MPHVPLIEDDQELLDLVSSYLHRYGCQVSTFHNELESIELTLSWTPDLVIIDMMLPGADGLTVLKQLAPGLPYL